MQLGRYDAERDLLTMPSNQRQQLHARLQNWAHQVDDLHSQYVARSTEVD